uniref:Zinc finger protein 460 n=1 Tax=Ceratitis capitata TaxID=7213 RepID=W8B2S5_CERCA
MEILCRICGGDQNLKFFQNDKQLLELLELCANVVIKENDMLPKFICKRCEDGLLFSYRLRKQSEETEKRLRHEIESQTISTTTDIEDELSAYNIQQRVPSVPQNRDQRLISDVDNNICTSTNQSEKTSQLVDAEPTHELTGSKDVGVEPSPNETSKENVVEILDLENMPELSDEERLQVELRKRGVIICKRVLPDTSGSTTEHSKDHEVIAEKRIQLDTVSQIMPVDDTEGCEQLPQIVSSETFENDASNEVDIIELLDDDEPERDDKQQEESRFEELKSVENEHTEIIEEIISSAEEEESQYRSLNEQTDIVYEESDSDCNELIDINECQMYFTKVEHNTFDDENRETRRTTIQDNSVVEFTTVISSKTITEETVSNYNCDICNIDFSNKYIYRNHVKIHDVKNFACTLCDKKFLRRDSLTRHIHAHNNKEELHCPLCERTFQSRFNLSRHARAVHKNMGFVCDVCGQIFMRSDVLQQHLVKHNTQGDVQCELCPKRFFALSSMRRHMLSHAKQSGEENLSNDTTESDVGTSKTSDKKEKTKKKIYCIYCGKMSKGHFAHKMHLRTHTQEKPHKCEICSKAFRTLAALTTHERIHDDVRPYQCEHCLLSFRQQGHLKEHRMIHEGIAPHVCSVCQLAFTKKCNMLVHMRIHSGDYPYKCLMCGEQFNRPTQLHKHHYKVHKKDVDEDTNGIPENVNDAEELNPEGDVESKNLANELSDSDSDSIEIIETENVPAASSIQSNTIGDDNDDEDCYEVTVNANKDVAVETSVTENISDDFVGINKGVVLVVDDNAKFNSLFIMDD